MAEGSIGTDDDQRGSREGGQGSGDVAALGPSAHGGSRPGGTGP